MDNLQTQIDNLKTLQQSYDALATQAQVQEDIQGRSQLAAAISAKGVPATVQDNLSSMATKVTQIPQELNTGVSDFEQVIAPSPYIWNTYSVANDLMKETLPDYLPAYMTQYKQQYGANSFFVGEYYLRYATLELTGADGYLTCDGDFYTIAGEAGSRIVTHTFPDGTTETYAAESIIHTWHDSESGRYNRYVAFFYLASAYSFTNATISICPRRVALCGECTSFVVSGENRLTNVWVIGTLGHFEGGTTAYTWDPMQVIRNYKNHASGYMYTDFDKVSAIIPDLETISSVIFKFKTPKFIILPELKSINVNGAIYSSESPESAYVEVDAESISADALESISGRFLYGNRPTSYARRFNSLKDISLPKLKNISGVFIELSTNAGSILTNLTTIHLPKLISITGTFFNLTNYDLLNLTDLEVGEMITNLYFRNWNPTNVLADATKKAQLIDNIKNHILARVSDATGGTQLVFTISTNMYNAIASETITWNDEEMSLADAFLTKNWLLSGA